MPTVKLRNLPITHSRYNPKDFEPLTTEAWIYMAKLPTYKNLPPTVSVIPADPCAYCLPIDPIKAQWAYLDYWFHHFCLRRERKVEPAFFESLPGISSVLFDAPIEFNAEFFPMYGGFWEAKLKRDTEEELFEPMNHLRFQSTIAGAITAFYLATAFPRFHSAFLLSINEDEEKWYDRKEFGEPLGGAVNIPWGMRLEVIRRGHYLVSCLHNFSFDELRDVNVEVKDGVLQNYTQGVHFNDKTPPPYRESIMLQEHKLKYKIIV